MYDRLAKGKELAKISSKAKWSSRPIRPPTRANGDTEGMELTAFFGISLEFC